MPFFAFLQGLWLPVEQSGGGQRDVRQKRDHLAGAVHKVLDYWITAGDTPAEIEESYASVTGTVPMMPDYGMGFWQCKLRYQTQDELLNIAREYKKRGLPISVIVVDFFHWPYEGEWKFDPSMAGSGRHGQGA